MSGNFASALMIVLVCAVSVTVLRGIGFSAAPAVVCLGITAVLSLFADDLGRSIDSLLSFGEGQGLSRYLDGAVRIIGVGYASGICQDSCDALGEAALGRAASLAGRLEIVVIALPFFSEILQMGMEMIS